TSSCAVRFSAFILLPSPCFFCLFQRHGSHRYLHSFPTRRSSDLKDQRQDFTLAIGGCEVDDNRHVLQLRMALHSKLKDVPVIVRSEEHTSELQSLTNLVCRLLLEKKKQT